MVVNNAIKLIMMTNVYYGVFGMYIMECILWSIHSSVKLTIQFYTVPQHLCTHAYCSCRFACYCRFILCIIRGFRGDAPYKLMIDIDIDVEIFTCM